MDSIVKEIKKLQENGCESLSDLERIFGELDRSRRRSRKFGQKHIFSVSKNRFAISRNTIIKQQQIFGNEFFVIALDWAYPSRLFCFPFGEFSEIIEDQARIGYGTASYNQNPYIFGFNIDNTCTWGGTRLDTSQYLVPHHNRILSELDLRIKSVTQKETTISSEPIEKTSIQRGYLLDLIEPDYASQIEGFLAGIETFDIELEKNANLIEVFK